MTLYYDTTGLDEHDIVEKGLPLIEASNAHQWQLGDLAAAFEVKVGRPANDDEATKLVDLAKAWGKPSSTISPWRLTSKFWPKPTRSVDFSWEFYNRARTEIKKRMKGADLDAQQAYGAALLEIAELRHFDTESMVRYVRGIYFEGSAHVSRIPSEIRSFLPPDADFVWVVVSQLKEDE